MTDELVKSKMEFTTVYFGDNLAILVPEGSSHHLRRRPEGVSVGAQQATSGKAYAKENGAEVIRGTKTPPHVLRSEDRSGPGSRSEPLVVVRGTDQ